MKIILLLFLYSCAQTPCQHTQIEVELNAFSKELDEINKQLDYIINNM